MRTVSFKDKIIKGKKEEVSVNNVINVFNKSKSKFMAFTGLILGFVVIFFFVLIELNSYKDQARSYALNLRDLLDKDKVVEYRDTLVPDDYYYEIENYIYDVLKNSKVFYHSVLVLDPVNKTDAFYIWDGEAEATERELTLGKPEPTVVIERGEEQIVEASQHMTIYFEGNKPIGLIYTPLYATDGSFIGACEADILLTDAFLSILAFAAIIIVLIVIIVWIGADRMTKDFVKYFQMPLETLDKLSQELYENMDNEALKEYPLNIEADGEIGNIASTFEKVYAKAKSK